MPNDPRELSDRILDDGYVVHWVPGDPKSIHHALPRAYTVGRTVFGPPELLVSGLDPLRARTFLAHWAEIDVDNPLVHGLVTPSALVIQAEPGVLSEAITALVRFEALQIVWRESCDGLDVDRDQRLYSRGFMITHDPYSA